MRLWLGALVALVVLTGSAVRPIDGRQLTFALQRHLEAVPSPSLTRLKRDDVEDRSFVDLMPHVGSFLLRGLVRRMLIRPVIGGFKRLIPDDFYTYYREKLLKRRFFKVISPLSPLVSSYAYNKFEQGIFWTLKKGYNYVSDNFIEWEVVGDDERRRRRRSSSTSSRVTNLIQSKPSF